jgi:hypothetical protein
MNFAEVQTFSAAHCIPFQPPLTCLTKKAVVANDVSLTGGK